MYFLNDRKALEYGIVRPEKCKPEPSIQPDLSVLQFLLPLQHIQYIYQCLLTDDKEEQKA